MARQRLEAVLDASPASVLLVALDGGGRVLGFACTAPLANGKPGSEIAELRYLGVEPSEWGRGIGTALLAGCAATLRAAGCSGAVLQVYADNAAAIGLYRTMGWRPIGPAHPHSSTGRMLQDHALDLGPPRPAPPA
ncbi:MAG TPA: GNAT family N-acetyltransferase [Candidatus Binatia bacterium]|nr:GNAT family N-acetyltransferase [Candidatus Binatia bacterium]